MRAWLEPGPGQDQETPGPINTSTLQHFTSIELRQVDPKRNRRRLYCMVEARTLFGEPCIIVTRGRIGGSRRIRTEVFDSQAPFERRWEELLRRRLLHGYVVLCEAEA